MSILKNAYQDLKERVELPQGDNQTSLIRQTILTFDRLFSISDIVQLHPAINRELIKKVLLKMKNEKTIEMVGKGRGAKWKLI